MKSTFKWTGIVVGIVIGLIVLATLSLYSLGQMRLKKKYEVPTHIVALPTDADSLGEGKRIFQYRGCEACHGEQLEGLVYLDNPPIGQVITPNLTTGQGGIGSLRKDEELIQAIRHGIRPDGTPLLFMPSTEFYYLSNEDLGKVLAYIRSTPSLRASSFIGTNRADVRVVIVRASDVPTYVQYGAADLGIAGKDVLLEHGGEGLYQPLDLEIARCRMVVATRRGFEWEGCVQRGARIRAATKYVRTAREHFAAKGMHVDLIKLYGSMELAPLTGLADAIVDLVSSGNTLKANDLVAVEDILSITSRLVVNPGALKLKRDLMQPLIEALGAAAQASSAAARKTRQ